MILADTSAWIEFQRATGSPIDRRMLALFERDRPLAFTDPIRMELLGGARTDADSALLAGMLGHFQLLPLNAPDDFESAALIYRRCRAKGITPRGFIDCMIAAVALRNGAAIITQNSDLEKIAKVMQIELA